MSISKQTLNNILKGKFLVDQNAKKNWGFIIFLTALALLMITSSHRIDTKVQKLAQLNKKKRELRSRSIATESYLMKLKMQSSISRRMQEKGLYTSQTPPQKVKAIVVN